MMSFCYTHITYGNNLGIVTELGYMLLLIALIVQAPMIPAADGLKSKVLAAVSTDRAPITSPKPSFARIGNTYVSPAPPMN